MNRGGVRGEVVAVRSLPRTTGRLAVTLLVAACVSVAATATSQAAELYLMSVDVGDVRLADDLPVHAADGEYFVALGAFLQCVDFPIRREGLRWTGWQRSPDRVFDWSADESSRALWRETEDGMAVAVGQLEAWFDLTLEVDPRRQRIVLRSAEPLPFQERARRTARRERSLSASYHAAPVELPDSYRFWSAPMFDVSLHSLWSGGGAGSRDSQSVSIDASMDLLKHSLVYDGRASRSTDEDIDLQQRLTFSRAAATEGGSLGWGITRYEFGDVFSAGSNLVDGGGSGAGFVVERRSKGQVSQLDDATIAGDATPGWDVELSRNGQLVALTVVDEEGRYVIDGLEVFRGENLFVARLFGPQGQVLEQRHVVWGGGVDLERGETEFRVSHVDFSERLLDGEREGDTFQPAERLTDLRFSTGLSGRVQAGAAYSWSEVASRKEDDEYDALEHATLHGRAGLARGVFLGELVHQIDGGSAWSLQYLTSFHRHDLTVMHRSFDEDFESGRTRRQAKPRSRSQVTLAGPLSWGGFQHYLLRLQREEIQEGATDLRVFTRLGGSWGPVGISNDLEYSGFGDGEASLRGRLRVAGRWGAFGWRGTLDYEPTADDLLQHASATLRWRASSAIYSSWTVRHQVNGEGTSHFEGLVSARVRGVDISLRAAMSTDDAWSAGVNVLLHLGRDGSGQGLLSQRPGLARRGRARLRLFVDENNNGRRDAAEVPVRWAAYRGRETSEEEPGVLALGAVPAETAVVIESRHFQFDDPFLMPRDDRYQVYTHPGADMAVDIPVVLTGDLAGHVVDADGEGRGGVTLRLVAQGGRRVGTTRSEHDGYYAFHRIPSGSYRVEVVTQDEATGASTAPFTLDPSDGFRLLALLELGGKPPAAEPSRFERLIRAALGSGTAPFVNGQPARTPRGAWEPSLEPRPAALTRVPIHPLGAQVAQSERSARPVAPARDGDES